VQGYQTLAHFWVHHIVSTLKCGANKIQQKKGPKISQKKMFLLTIQHYSRMSYTSNARKKEDDDMPSGKSFPESLLEPRLPPLPLRILKSPLASWAFVPRFLGRD
jgi:hypothetical protein